jgi:hypothetical protein
VQSLYCAGGIAKGRNAGGTAERRNKAIAPYGPRTRK